jgi:hypothetical protein
MNPPVCKTVVLEEMQSASASGDVFATVDTKGYDYMVLQCELATVSAAHTAMEILRIGEADTVPTDVTTDTTVLPAFSCGAAVAATCDNILPALSSTKQNLFQFNIDLRGRKRYLALDLTPVQTCSWISLNAHLFRNNSGDDPIETVATTSDGLRLVASG